MAILDKESFFASIKTRVGDDVSDDAMKFIEDMTDTYNSLTEKTETEDEKSVLNFYKKMTNFLRPRITRIFLNYFTISNFLSFVFQ